ncbi:MAG TPA: hypothetical protein VLB82_06100 [Thermodesulfobacteriota bacterium]|nr:hypothetical protein [Thermodesulfobacteriota bacterium]
MTKILHKLFTTPGRSRSLIYLVAAIPFILVGLFGWEHGAFWFYLVPAIIAVVQFFKPRMFIWCLLLLIYFVASIQYFYLLIADIIRILTGGSPSALLDTDDSVVFITFVLVIVSVTVFLIRRGLKDWFANSLLKEQ